MTAAERAAEVIRAAIAHNACCDECAVLPDAPWAVDARLARDALMADPALLVDLAIAAGAWERYAMCAECGEWVNPEPGHSCPRCDTVTDVSIPVAIARRTTQENQP